jgi:hypothetical protein
MLPLAPEGTPYKMRGQEYAFNGDIFLAEEFLRLRDKYGFSFVVETGTYIGTTTLWFVENFGGVTSLEVVPQFHAIASARLEGNEYATVRLMPGAEFLASMNENWIKAFNPLIFLDAHPVDGTGKGYDVVIQELEAIAVSGAKPSVLVLHDFQVPDHPEFQFDKFDGKPFTYEWVKSSLDRIYGEGGYSHYWNSQATGAKVGVLFVECNKEVTEPITNPTL